MDDRGNANPDLGHAEPGVVRGDPEVAGGGDFEAAAEAPARHPCDHRRRKRAYSFAKIAQTRDEFLSRSLIELCHFLDVGAADHALLALARDDEDANLPVRRERLQPFANAPDDGRSEDIQRAGIADREANDPARVPIDAAMGIE